MEERMKVAFRVRLNGRIPDPQDKYRDEITQEATIELEENHFDFNLIYLVEEQIVKIHEAFYAELNRLGGYNYQETK